MWESASGTVPAQRPRPNGGAADADGGPDGSPTGARLEIVRRLNRAFNARDPEWVQLYTDDAEIHVPPGWLEDRVFRGHREVEEVAGLWTDSVAQFHWKIEDLIDAGESLVGLFRFSSRVVSGGEWLAPPLGAVFYVRENKISRVLTYFSWTEALAAAGLPGHGA